MDVAEDTATHTRQRERPLLMPCFYFLEIPLFGTAAVLTYILHFTKVFRTNPVTLDPNDVTLSRPYTTAENRSISTTTLFIFTTAVPCILILFVEFFLVSFSICCKTNLDSPIGSTGCYISASLRRLVRFIGVYLFGMLITSILCDVFRMKTGILPPHFLSICRAYDAKDDTSGFHKYPQNFTKPDPLQNIFYSDDCLPIAGIEPLKAQLECPSYFVCLTAYGAVFTLLYLRLLAFQVGPTLKTLITWTTLFFTYYVGLIQIAENANHVSSVVYGWILGALCAYLIAQEMFRRNFLPKCKCSIDCQRERRKNMSVEANNVFEDPVTPKFSLRNYDVVAREDVTSIYSNQDDHIENARPKSQLQMSTSHPALAESSSPAMSKYSRSTSEQPGEGANGQSVERKVIKELQNYMTDTDFRGGLDSPRPTQIRELSRGQGKNRKQVLSTFQSQPDIEVHNEMEQMPTSQNIPEDLHAAGSVTESPIHDLPLNLQKFSSCEIRPCSYHANAPNDEGLIADEMLLAPKNEQRPLSFSFVPRNSIQGKNSLAGTSMTSSFLNNDPRVISALSFLSDEDNSESSTPTSPITPLMVPGLPDLCADADEKDVVDETCVLLREVYNVMKEKPEDDKTNDSEEDDSDDTVTGDQQPSIVV